MSEYSKHLLDGSLEQYNDTVVPKIAVFGGNDMTSEVYYFKPGQILKSHRHPNGEQIFVFLKGSGVMMLEDDKFEVEPGKMIFVPSGKWHEIINGDGCEMVAVQITKVGAGAEYKEN
ncbi:MULTISPECIES: cupin domain-containing protein [unclassified Clostridium]|uniref:cupin domain-containing protein n=1 Tax=Clostridium TaxID=1485 RepID=UPI001C8C82A3|nr:MULTISPECIES: cupin domain-containing protein [unclassified Clostridium]MBX9138832.1 cupin domain-containing protein [Clostridium sp. K12(2020)]MBX9145595.1 cupin domain-containing protein [Clostridium sp. K13]MDU2292155.1 cupin domain-containing protein [Clostridium celatum]MDU4326788.1 cupin domain-containing protein [Clostridium celatum]